MASDPQLFIPLQMLNVQSYHLVIRHGNGKSPINDCPIKTITNLYQQGIPQLDDRRDYLQEDQKVIHTFHQAADSMAMMVRALMMVATKTNRKDSKLGHAR